MSRTNTANSEVNGFGQILGLCWQLCGWEGLAPCKMADSLITSISPETADGGDVWLMFHSWIKCIFFVSELKCSDYWPLTTNRNMRNTALNTTLQRASAIHSTRWVWVSNYKIIEVNRVCPHQSTVHPWFVKPYYHDYEFQRAVYLITENWIT